MVVEERRDAASLNLLSVLYWATMVVEKHRDAAIEE